MEKALKDMRVEEFAKHVESIPDWRLDETIASLQRRRLFGSGLQGTAEGKRLHKGIIVYNAKGGAAFLPMPGGRGIHAAKSL
jgi:hypothetical protein